MSYADFVFYQTEYLGNSISEEDFPRLALRASSFLDYYTMGIAAKNPELNELKMACCALAEQMHVVDAAQASAVSAMGDSSGAELQSQTVGGWSKTYRAGGETAQASMAAADDARKALYGTAQTYLAHTGLLYRGGRCIW